MDATFPSPLETTLASRILREERGVRYVWASGRPTVTSGEPKKSGRRGPSRKFGKVPARKAVKPTIRAAAKRSEASQPSARGKERAALSGAAAKHVAAIATSDPGWDAALERLIKGAQSDGDATLEQLVSRAQGADPRVVADAALKIGAGGGVSEVSPAARNARARRSASEFQVKLPAADPMSSQWWYTLDAIELLAGHIARIAGGGKVAFLGSPTIGQFYATRYGRAVCLDHDADVVAALNKEHPGLAFRWDVREGDEALRRLDVGTFAVAVLDPPWYPNLTKAFIRTATLLVPDGRMFCTLPSELTRPGVIQERSDLVRWLLRANILLVGIDTASLSYVVPQFEANALRGVKGFSGRPWRRADLLSACIGPAATRDIVLDVDNSERPETIRFHRGSAAKFRIFLCKQRAQQHLRDLVEPVVEFATNISSRHFDSTKVTMWTSTKVGASVRNADHAEIALASWALGEPASLAVEALVTRAGLLDAQAREFVRQLNGVFSLWTEDRFGRRLTTPEIQKAAQRGDLAAPASDREFETSGDGFRLEFQRDRDRVLWSSGLKRLANKTQVFSFDEDDNVRQRLAHSVEVMQLASTVGASFGLDLDLIEAGAMAHDIGHTPFGHAGEFALNSIVNQLAPRAGGFNHYEHGVDVVRWLEDVYRSPSSDGHPGLNLTPEVSECIFKHTYCREGRPYSQSELYRVTKHQDLFRNDACHLEGQAVRAADKISYLVSDLEDGIRLGVFQLEDLSRCRLFLRPPIDIKPQATETLLERFLAQRRVILKVLMEDLILETERQLLRVGAVDRLRSVKDYVIKNSDDVAADCEEIWRLLQTGLLHQHRIVRTANIRAAKIVSELFFLFLAVPNLLPEEFVRSHSGLVGTAYMKQYTARCGKAVALDMGLVRPLHLERLIGLKLPKGSVQRVPVHCFVMAKDYLASLTDGGARRLHAKLLAVK